MLVFYLRQTGRRTMYTLELGDMPIFSHRPSSVQLSPIGDIFASPLKRHQRRVVSRKQKIYTLTTRRGRDALQACRSLPFSWGNPAAAYDGV